MRKIINGFLYAPDEPVGGAPAVEPATDPVAPAADPPAADPATPAAVAEPPALTDEQVMELAVQRGLVQPYTAPAAAAPATSATSAVPDPYAEAAQLMYDGKPEEALRRTAEIATAEALKQVDPYLRQQNMNTAVEEFGKGRSEAAKTWLRQKFPNLNPAKMSPQERELLNEAMENIDRKAQPAQRVTVEPAHSAPAIQISDDVRKTAHEFAALAGRPAPTDAEIALQLAG